MPCDFALGRVRQSQRGIDDFVFRMFRPAGDFFHRAPATIARFKIGPRINAGRIRRQFAFRAAGRFEQFPPFDLARDAGNC